MVDKAVEPRGVKPPFDACKATVISLYDGPKFGRFYPPPTQISTHSSLMLSGEYPSGHALSMKSIETVLEIVLPLYFMSIIFLVETEILSQPLHGGRILP
jgi:hypothetical protein